MGTMHRMMRMKADSSGGGHMCPDCQHGMHGKMSPDSTSSMRHGAMSGMRMMRPDSSSGEMGMCTDCMGKGVHHRGAAADSLSGKKHGMMHGAGAMCPHCKGKKTEETPEEDTSYRGIPDDDVHRRLRPSSDTEADAKAMPAPGGESGGGMHSMMSGMLEAQALWDATMAHSIVRYLESEPGALVMHAVGGFHVEYGTGIPEQMPGYRPDVKQVVVAVRPSEDITVFEDDDRGRGDFVVLTDANLPRTYETRTE
jgi:hypothetical protein